MSEKEALLSTSPWVKAHFIKSDDLRDEDIALIKNIGEKRHYPKGAVITDMGDRGEYMYFVLEGTVRYSLLSSDGVEKPVSFITPGCFIGDEPFFHGQPTLYHAVALEEVKAIAISRKYLPEILARPGLVHVLLKSLSHKSRILATQVEDLAFRNTVEKVSRILYCIHAENSDIKKTQNNYRITQQELAAFAGAHRVSITNAISQLKKEGIIKTAKDGSVIVTDWEKLKEKGFNN